MKKVLFALFAVVMVTSAFTIIQDGYDVGDKARDFELMNVDGEKVKLADFKAANGFIIAFTCNHCPYAVMYEDRLISLHNEFAPKGYPVIAINPNDPEVKPEDSFEKMKVRAAEKEFPFPYLMDEGQQIYPQFGATKTPHIYVLDKDLVVQYIGAIDDNAQADFDVEYRYVAMAINALEKGEMPNPSTTKAVGCSIKTKK